LNVHIRQTDTTEIIIPYHAASQVVKNNLISLFRNNHIPFNFYRAACNCTACNCTACSAV